MRVTSIQHTVCRSSVCFLLFIFSFLLLASCSLQKKIERSAESTVLNTPALKAAHVGISIFEPATNSFWYNYQGDKYFVPASNTKIPTCYAAMKYLGDSLVGLRYGFDADKDTSGSVLVIQPAGDPSFLHKDFYIQPVWSYLSRKADRYRNMIAILDTIWKDERWGSGWSWSDYDADYMAEKSVMPVFGNVIDIKLNDVKERRIPEQYYGGNVIQLFKTQSSFFDSIVNASTYRISKENAFGNQPNIELNRAIAANEFWIKESNRKFTGIVVPFVTGNLTGPWQNSYATAADILKDTLKLIFGSVTKRNDTEFVYYCPDCKARKLTISKWHTIHSQPTDSLLKPMMHRSDNFFAEQALLMVCNEKLGVMNDAKIIDTLLKTDFKDLPQAPRWADGSGLSRYNLFTPQDFVAILHKMKNEFGMERLKEILPTGGEGTISNYYKSDSGYIYAKTGTLSGVVAFSGFLYTRKGKLLIFSTLVNNHRGSATDVRRAMEKFLQKIRVEY